jgi:hypothetical protein
MEVCDFFRIALVNSEDLMSHWIRQYCIIVKLLKRHEHCDSFAVIVCDFFYPLEEPLA